MECVITQMYQEKSKKYPSGIHNHSKTYTTATAEVLNQKCDLHVLLTKYTASWSNLNSTQVSSSVS